MAAAEIIPAFSYACGTILAKLSRGGRVLLDGAALPGGRRLRALRGDRLVYIPQNGAEFLLPARTVRKQLYDSLKKLGLPRKDFPASAAEKLRLAGFDAPEDVFDRYSFQLSGGMAQRVALARCLLLSPKLLILDEATSMLDVSTQANLLALEKAQMLPNGGSVLFISHDRALTDHYCDTVYEFDEDHRLKEVRA